MGTSLAWWANVFGDRDDFADLRFTTKNVVYKGQSLPGLGMNIARYNHGACSWNAVEGQRMAVSPNVPRFKQNETCWQDWRNTDPTSSAWKWTADAKQRAAVFKAAEHGAMTRAVLQLTRVVDVHQPQPLRGFEPARILVTLRTAT